MIISNFENSPGSFIHEIIRGSEDDISNVKGFLEIIIIFVLFQGVFGHIFDKYIYLDSITQTQQYSKI